MPLVAPINYGARLGGIGDYALTPEDEESLIRKAANIGLSGLGMVGNALGIPGSVARDLLTWLPFAGARRANPFDQLLPQNWFSSEGRTSGRDLLSDYGLMNPNKETGIAGWRDDPMEGLRDVGGFAADVVTDPFFWWNIGRGALGRGAEAVRAAGLGGDVGKVAAQKTGQALGELGPRQAGMVAKVGDVLAQASPEARAAAQRFAGGRGYDLLAAGSPPPGAGGWWLAGADGPTYGSFLNEPMRGLASLKPMFFKNPLGVFGSGPTSQKVAAFLDKFSPNPFEFGSAYMDTIAGKSVRALMHAPTMGRVAKEVVPHAQAFFDDQTKALAGKNALANDWTLRAERSGVYDPRVTRAAAEGVPGVVDPTGLADELRTAMQSAPARERAAGFRSRELNDQYIDHVPRHVEGQSTIGQRGEELAGTPSGPMSLGAGADQKGRDALFGGFPKGSEQLNTVASDPELHSLLEAGKNISGMTRKQTVDAVAASMQTKYAGQFDPTIPKQTADGSYVFQSGQVDAKGKPITFEISSSRVNAGQWNQGRTVWTGHGGTEGEEVLASFVAATDNHYKELASWMYDNPKLATEGLFTRDPLLEGAERMGQVTARENVSKHLLNFANDHSLPAGSLSKDQATTLGEMFGKVGMDRDLAREAYARRNNIPIPPNREAVTEAAQAGHITPDQAIAAHEAFGKWKSSIDNRQIKKSLADDYAKPVWQPSLKGTPFEPLVAKIDSFTSLFKAGVLSWPSTKVRDLTSGQIESALGGVWGGASAADTARIMAGQTVKGLGSNLAIAEMLKRQGKAVTDEAATDLMRTVYAAHATGSIKATAGDIVQQTAPVYGKGREQVLDVIPGAQTKGFLGGAGDILKTAFGFGSPTAAAGPDLAATAARLGGKLGSKVKAGRIVQAADRSNFGKVVSVGTDTSKVRFINPSTGATATVDLPTSSLTPVKRTGSTWNPFRASYRGVGGATESTLGPIAAMERVGNLSDTANRMVPWLEMVKQGIDPGEAMRRVARSQVSYDPRTYTALERGLKRVLPFYSYLSRKGVDVGRTLTSEPGKGLGQAVRAIAAGRNDNQLLPEYLGDTAAIPLAARTADGTSRFLTGLGLMFESPLSFVGTPRSAGLELMSQMNPLLKGPLEHFTGQTFFQKGPEGGRPLEDLDPTLGRILSNLSGAKEAVQLPPLIEQLIGNSPLSRVATTMRQMTESPERKTALDKALLFGTGVRFSDVSPGAQDALLRESLRRMEKALGGKTFSKSWIPDDVKAALSPAERLDALKMEALMNVLNRRAKERAKEAR